MRRTLDSFLRERLVGRLPRFRGARQARCDTARPAHRFSRWRRHNHARRHDTGDV